MHAKVAWLLAKGDKDGHPPQGDVPGGETMYATAALAHKNMVFLNKNTVYRVLEELRDMGLFPVVMKDHPSGRVCNFAQFLYTFAILYLHYEGPCTCDFNTCVLAN